MKKIHYLFLFLLSMLFAGSINAQSLSYGYFFNLANGAEANTNTLITTGETVPQGMTFSPDGTKLFVAGQQSDEVNQYTLTTAFDITAGVTHNGFHTVASQGGLPYDVAFSTSGNKMFVLNTGEVDQYSLTTPFDITSGVTFDGTPYSVTGQEAAPQSLTFSDDGTRMFIIGTTGGDVNQYTLTSAFNITSGVSFNGAYSVVGVTNTPYGVSFADNGNKMFISSIGSSKITQYDLSTPYTITSGVSYNGVQMAVSAEISSARDTEFNADGSRMFVFDHNSDDITQYDLNIGGFSESDLNDGSVTGSLDMLISGETFTNAGGNLGSKTDYAIANSPAGLFPTIAVAGDGSSATLTLSGTANDHQDLNDLSSLTFTFANSAFTGGNAGAVANSTAASSQLGIDFEDNNPKLTYGFAYDMTNAVVEGGPASVVSEDAGPTSVAFNSDGTKMFVLGNTGDDVNQYTLSVPFDLTAPITFDGSPYSVAGQTTSPWSIRFNSDGSRMYILTSAALLQYDLSIPFNVTSGVTYDDFLSIAAQENGARGFAFNNDGSKLFISGTTGDDITQFSLTTPFDITAGVSVDGNPFSVANETTSPSEMSFSDDGTKMLVLSGNPDWVYQYSLSTPYDITGNTTYDNVSFYVGLQEAFPAGMNFSADGSKMYIIGSAGDDINQYDLNVGGFNEVLDNDGSVEGSLTIRITDDSFVNANGTLLQSTHYTISNLPAGLTPSLAVAADGRSADLSITGSASDHQDVNDLSSLTFTFQDAAFDDSDASEVANAVAAASGIVMDFDENVASLTYGFFYNLSNGATPSTSHSVVSEESTSQSVAFSDDGLTMLVLGSGDDEVNQYSLTTAFDVSSGVSHVGLFSVASEVTAPNGMTFSADGTKMFLTGFENFGKVFQYSLTTPYVVTSGVSFDYFFNISSQEGTPQGITFNTDGTKMYIVGSAGDEVNQYSLSTPFDVTLTSVTFDNVTFSVSGDDTFPTDIAFNPDGSMMFIIGGVGKDINQYRLASPFDLSVGVTNDGTPFSISGEENAPRGIAFNDDGSRLFVAGSSGDVNQYEVNVGGFEEAAGNDGSVSGSLTIHIVEDTFTSQGGTFTSGADYSIDNLPGGLTPSLAVAGDGLSATLTLSGNALSHQDDNDLNSLQFTFTNSAFTSLTAATIQNTIGAESNIGMDFNDNPFLTYGSFYNLTDGGTYSGNSFDFSNETTSIRSISFSNDGLKMFVMAGNRNVYQYSLSIAFDLGSTITHDGSPFATGTNEPRGLKFNPTGTKMYIVDNKLNQVTQFSLTTPFDITSGVASDGSRSIVAQTGSDSGWGIAFNADGSKMFISGIADDLVHQYTLEVPFDLTSSVTYDNVTFDPTSQLLNPTYLTFNPEGTVLYISNYQYALSTPFDISSGVTPVGPITLTNNQNSNIHGVHFSADGAKLYLGSDFDDSVHEYLVNTGGFSETDSNDGEVEGSLLVSITGDTFTNAGSTMTQTTDYAITNLPSGLTPTLTVAADGLTATLTLSGNSAAHQDANDLAGLDFTFENTAFTNSNATAVIDAIGFSTSEGIDFNDNFPVMVYDYAYNPANFSYAGRLGVASQENSPGGLTFNDDGTRVYIVGTTNDQIFQYSLSTAFDVTTGSLDGNSISLNSEDDFPGSLAFNNDGTKLFMGGAGNQEVFLYTLSTPYDVTTGFSFSSTSLDVSVEGSPSGLAFSEDGMKLFTVSATTDRVNQYALTTAYDITSGVTVDGSYSVFDQENTPTGIAFNSQGTKMIIMGASTQASQKYIHNYHLESPFDITSGVTPYDNPVNVASLEFSPTDIAVSNSGDRVFILGLNGDEINQLSMQVGNLTESASNDGSVTGSYTLQLYDELFANAGGTLTQGADYSISNLPSGLSSSLAVAADGKTAVLSISGTATDNDNSDGVESLLFTFENSAFSIGDASIVVNAASASSELSIRFIEAPSISNQTFSIAENSANDTSVGTVIATDSDGDAVTFSITAGNDLGGFAIDANTGEVTVADQADMDFETNPSFDLTIQVSDGSLTNTATVTIDLTDVSETPTDLAIDVNSLDENNAVNDVIGQLSTTDVDAGESFTYSLVSGTGDTDNASFNINNDQLRASDAFDFESKDTYSIRIQTDDGNSGTFEKALTINISNVFEAPTDITISGFNLELAENNSIGDPLSTFSTVDEDAGETYTYTLVSGTGDADNASFNITGDELQAAEVFDFETQNSYSIRVQTDDGNGNTYEEVFPVSITNEAANITDIAIDSENVDENEVSGTVTGLLSTVGTEVTGSLTYSLVSGTGDNDNGSFGISGSQLITAEVFDFETKSSYSIRVQTDDGKGVTFEKAFTITIDNVFETPTDLSLSASVINENNATNTSIGTLSTVDEDAGETYTYTLASGSGDTDNASFNISGNQLRASEVFNFENKDSYAIRLQTNDGNGGIYQKQFAITINDLSEAPVDLALSVSSITENNAINATVGVLSTNDEDAGETYTYTLVSGTGDTHNSSFNISGTQLRASEIFDFESQNSYSVRIQTNDGNGGIYQESINISINNQSEAPTDLLLSSSDIDESSPAGSTVGVLNTTDEDNGETYTYTLVSGTGSTDNASFSISGDQLLSAEIFDFESKTSYSIRVQTNDGNGGIIQKAFTISINNLPPGLTGVSITSSSVNENLTAGSLVGNLFALGDEIDGVVFTFSMVSGTGDTNNGLFTISSGQLLTSASFDFESVNQYSIRVMADDGVGSTIDQVILIDVNDVNESPSDIQLTASSINENNSLNEAIGSFSSTDEDSGDTHSYSLVSGAGDADNSSFTVAGNQLQATEIFDFETKSSFSIRVQTSDGSGGTFEKAFSINVNDVNDDPSALTINASSIDESNAINAIIGSFSTTDEDSGDSFTYSLVSGSGDTDNSDFSILGNQLQAGISFDFETKNNYSIRVATNDGNGGTFEQAFSIDINDINENPSDIMLSNSNIEESNPTGTFIGSFSSIDQDAGQTFTYSLVAGTGDTDNSSFSISGSNLLSAEVFDFETKASYSIRVRTTDGNGGQYEESFNVSIIDLPASITSFDLSSASIVETLAVASIVGVFSTSGEDLSGSFTYTLISGTGDADNSSFTISGDQLLTNSGFDFETKSSYSILVMTDDGGQSEEQVFNIMITDVSEAPTAVLLSANSISENNAINDVIGNFSTTDEDAGETHTYTLVSGSGDTDNSSFAIVGNQLQAAEAFDFETQSAYSIRVETNDGNAGTFQAAFSISITDENENNAPVLVSPLSSVTFDNGFVIGTRNLATAFTDADSDPITLSVTSSDESVATVDFTGTTLNMNEVGIGTTTITVTADDGKGGVTNADFDLTINFVAQTPPTAISINNTSVDENSPVSTLVGQLSATDVNIYDEIVYTLVSGSGDDDNASFLISGFSLRTNAVLDFDAAPTRSIRVQADDQNGGTFQQAFTITVNDLNDNSTPTVVNPLNDHTDLIEGFVNAQISYADVFSDADGDALTISVSSSDESVATVEVILNDEMQINEVGIGSTTITITANDGNGGSVSDEFIVTISEALNNAPIVVNPLNDQTALIEGFVNAQINYADVFSDADGDVLTISVSSSDESVATAVVVLNDEIQINEVGIGTTTITITANDGNGGSVSDEFIVTISEELNNVPIVVNPLNDQTALIEGFVNAQINYADVFSDADGDALTITVSSSDESVATVEVVLNDEIQINEVGVGTTTITITANDGNGGSVSDEFIVTISEAPNNAPVVVNPINDQSEEEGFVSTQVSYTDTFSDSDGDNLTISVASSDESVVSVELITNDQIQITETGIGVSTITITANDGNGETVTDEFTFTVTEAPLGFEEKIEVSVYPNPASENLFIRSAEFLSVKIVNTEGKELRSGSGKEFSIDIKSMQPGIYILIMKSENSLTQRRIIKAN